MEIKNIIYNNTIMKFKNYILIEKYRLKLFGVKIFYYTISLNNKKCKYNTIEIKKKKIQKTIINKLRFLDPLFKKKIFKKKIYKNDKDIMQKIFKLFDKRHKYTYCLNANNLTISSTKVKKTDSKLKNILSKHIILCEDNPYAAGEMVFYKKNDKKKYMVFDNSSGTYKPKKENLENLKKILYFLKTIVVERYSKKHELYFSS